ncbi:unnamed protein product [Lactuca saligna]|uniref:Uncharacterized protein n=1 Tax=Lactuca saligna TaxID=75948 RepID=A0AA35YBR0_LACSI|nr:unnamed protein product [Lactuca saligna]
MEEARKAHQVAAIAVSLTGGTSATALTASAPMTHPNFGDSSRLNHQQADPFTSRGRGRGRGGRGRGRSSNGRGRGLKKQLLNLNGSSNSMDTLIEGAFQLITDESKAGSCLLITNSGGLEYMPTSFDQEEKNLAAIPSRLMKTIPLVVNSSIEIPDNFKQL